MTKIEITIKGKKLLLTVAQARAVRRDLNRLFGEPPEEEMSEDELVAYRGPQVVDTGTPGTEVA